LGFRDGAATITATAGAGVLAALSWFYNSPIFGIVFGIILGAMVTEFVQSRAWKRTVNRELAMKNIETMYTPLFKEIASVMDQAQGFTYLTAFTTFEVGQCTRIKAEPYYLFIPAEMQPKLSTFYSLVSKFKTLRTQVTAVRNFVLKEASEFYGVPIEEIMYTLVGGGGITYSTTFLINPILYEKHPKDVLSAPYPDRTDLKYRVYYTEHTSKEGPVGRRLNRHRILTGSTNSTNRFRERFTNGK